MTETNQSNNEHTDPIKKKKDVQKTNDEHIDQDFPGFPNLPSKENIISPKTETDKLVAESGTGEINSQKEHPNIDEIFSFGSANAFSSTEEWVDDDTDRLNEK